MKRRSFIAVLFLSFILLAQAGAIAYASPERVTDFPENQGRPDVKGNIIVWKDYRAGNWDIYAYNKQTGIEEPVSTNPAYQNVPVTNGVYVVWQDNRNGANDIYVKNLVTGVTRLLAGGPGNQGLPDIDGNLVTYVDDAMGNNNIYVMDLTSSAVTAVTTDAGNQWQPRISGGRVVWEDNRNGDWDIYIKDLQGGSEQQLAGGPGDQRVADIDGDISVWQDSAGGAYDIWMKDLGAGTPAQPVTADGGYKNSPRVSNDLVVWENYNFATADYDILARDLTAGDTLTVAGGHQTQARPAIDGETVVWEEDSGGDYDIWMEQLPDTIAPAVSNIAPADGGACGCRAPRISAALSDNRTGVDSSSVRLWLDGQEVTGAAEIGETMVSYQAPGLQDGSHSVSLTVSDIAGNTAAADWQFTSDTLDLKLDFLQAFWASYQDYVNRQLSVDYRVNNLAPSADSGVTEIIAAPSTSGVLLASPAPMDLGVVSHGFSRQFTIKYLVPGSVSSFKSRVFMHAVDACGSEFFLPGPPPAS